MQYSPNPRSSAKQHHARPDRVANGLGVTRLLREQESIEHAKDAALQVFRRDTSLERSMLNGRLTASLLIPDVRVGDIVEVGVTVYGSHPVLGGKYCAWTAFDPFNPWLERRHQLLRPLAREIFIREFNGPPERQVAVNGSIEDSRCRLVGQQRREAEDLTPTWLILAPALQYSGLESWNEVARLFAPLYENRRCSRRAHHRNRPAGCGSW
jgi:hypothetical protein